ncbi:DUF6074 family protein [Methylobacterium sp. WL9]|uniref:DUF6074 family protein n=1 Tax=Methylobacterium sp. WL9 TaxID=2603898 RepID=UPI0011C7E8EC|nr:DUF6074 family protein [Methylobacterium sp. WL9]TXN21270.1 hypothetical protein FV217_14840 [Methylobacterium sp. WL9]
MAIVLPFPAARRRGFICKQGARLADLPRREAEKHLAYQLRLQHETMARKGIDTAEIECQVGALETAIRCEIARNLVTYGSLARPIDDATVLQVIEHLRGEVRARGNQIEAQTVRLQALDRIERATGSRCITDTATMLKMGRDALYKWMNANRWIYRRARTETWVAHQERERAGLLGSVPYHYTGRDGSPCVKMQVLVTPKGLVRLAKLLGGQIDDQGTTA